MFQWINTHLIVFIVAYQLFSTFLQNFLYLYKFYSFCLGEEPFSYGYGGTAKFSTDCKFSTYGERFTKGDVITCLVDFQERPPTMSFSKNGRWFGVAKRLTEIERGNKKQALFPHILSKNCK